jgi:hypothetical protein
MVYSGAIDMMMKATGSMSASHAIAKGKSINQMGYAS